MKEHKNDKARIKVLREYVLFERAINFCLAEAEANLKARDLKDILKDYINEFAEERDVRIIRERIENSGHGQLIKAFYD